ncbi:hypothetical protein [Rugosimonospora africana]|uniref:WD40-like Beta Propeller Repeat n=1 Tax=Rugosimonospora africana TaxID=556532 RepID=A0A8J3VQW7_9ACTN|nr:hypothetical protein [Rugosimonospora africana]GIH14773.1 hypothetical protein Raf01_29450 [Rugosimonospora africana]
MGVDDLDGEPVDIIEFGGSGARPKPPWRRWLPVAAVVVVAAVAVVAAVTRGTGGSPSATSRPSSTVPESTLPAQAGPAASVDAVATPSPLVSQAGRPLLGVTAGWELLGQGSGGVVRVEFARGRITSTAVPPILSGGPVSFVAGPDWAMVRPLDLVPGYLVPDGQPARPLYGPLARTGPAVPGPDRNTVWVPLAGDDQTLILVKSDGEPAGPRLTVPPGVVSTVAPDGTGYLVFAGTGGVYAARPDGPHRITTGALIAAGPTRWLTWECDDRYRCAAVVIDRATGARRTVDIPLAQQTTVRGVISPDGSRAALIESGPNGSVTVGLYDLASGSTSYGVQVSPALSDPDSMVWSPDSRWLFIAGDDGALYPVDPATGEVHNLGVVLPHLTRLAVRPAPAG